MTVPVVEPVVEPLAVVLVPVLLPLPVVLVLPVVEEVPVPRPVEEPLEVLVDPLVLALALEVVVETDVEDDEVEAPAELEEELEGVPLLVLAPDVEPLVPVPTEELPALVLLLAAAVEALAVEPVPPVLLAPVSTSWSKKTSLRPQARAAQAKLIATASPGRRMVDSLRRGGQNPRASL